MRWVGIGWVDEGPATGQEHMVVTARKKQPSAMSKPKRKPRKRLPRFTQETLIYTLQRSHGVCWSRPRVAQAVKALWPAGRKTVTALDVVTMEEPLWDHPLAWEAWSERHRIACHMLPVGFVTNPQDRDAHLRNGEWIYTVTPTWRLMKKIEGWEKCSSEA